MWSKSHSTRDSLHVSTLEFWMNPFSVILYVSLDFCAKIHMGTPVGDICMRQEQYNAYTNWPHWEKHDQPPGCLRFAMSANLWHNCMTTHSLFWSACGAAQLGRSLNSGICKNYMTCLYGRLLVCVINSHMELNRKTPHVICCLSGIHCLQIFVNVLLTYIHDATRLFISKSL